MRGIVIILDEYRKRNAESSHLNGKKLEIKPSIQLLWEKLTLHCTISSGEVTGEQFRDCIAWPVIPATV
jgi:hypothetical protein